MFYVWWVQEKDRIEGKTHRPCNHWQAIIAGLCVVKAFVVLVFEMKTSELND